MARTNETLDYQFYGDLFEQLYEEFINRRKNLTRCVRILGDNTVINMHKRTQLTPLDRKEIRRLTNPTMEADAPGRTLPSQSPNHLFGY